MRLLIPLFLALLAEGRHSYVVNPAKNALDVVDAATSKVVHSVTVGPQPAGFAVTPDERRIFVCVGGRSEIAVIDAASLTKVKTIDVGPAPKNIYVTPDKTRMIATSDKKLSIINI